ncbi:MAG: hypothetical protein ACXVP8_05645, partial [Actinomycetota bacterium]
MGDRKGWQTGSAKIRRMRRVLGAVFSVTVLVAAAQLATAARAPSPGCSTTRKAIAADARGHILQPQSPGAPIPCGTR